MPFCPSCGYEYVQGIDMCPDCEVDLVDHLSEEHFEGELVEVFRSLSYPEAGLVKEMLRSEGIFSGLSNEFVSTIYGKAVSDMSEIRVFVSEDDAEKARDLIENYIDGNPLDEYEEYMVCSHCGAQVDADAEACPFCAERFDN